MAKQNIKTFTSTRKKLFAFLAIVIIIIIGYFLFGKKERATQYQTETVDYGPVVASVSVSGTVLMSNMINVTTNATGIVSKVYVKNGDYVIPGQKILTISLDLPGQQKNSENYASYLAAKNNLETAKATQYSLQSDMFTKWDKYYKLATNSTYQNSDGSSNSTNRTLPEFLTSQDDWLAAEAKYKIQASVISQAQTATGNAWLSYQQTSPDVVAPAGGAIDNLTYAPGMIISSQTSSVTTSTSNSSQASRIAVVATSGNPITTFNLAEVDILKVSQGQKATVKFDGLSGKTFAGSVLLVDRIGSVTNGVTTYPVAIQLDTDSQDILPNMSASANIVVERRDNVLKVPTAAISTQDTQSTVRVLKNNKPVVTPVEVGISSDSETEIKSGLKEGDRVVTATVETGSTPGRTSTPVSGSVFGGGSRGGNAVFRLGR